jgi:hypothetical protein
VTSSVIIDINTATTTTLVPAVEDYTIKVYKLVLFIGGTDTLTWQDSTPTTIYPAMSFSAGGTMVLDQVGIAWMECATGTSLQLVTSAAVQVSGRLWYSQGKV